MLVHYIEYLYLFPGTMNHIVNHEEILERDAKKIKIPDGCTGFRFFDFEVTIKDGKREVSYAKNMSGWYYCNCEKITLDEARKIFGKNESLEKYMKEKGIEYLVKTKSRHHIPLRKEDTII